MRAILAAALFALATTVIAAPKDRGQQWASLTVEQQAALAPLQNDWPRMSKEQKTKWLGIAKRYPKMKPEEQKRAQARMQKWVKLTPEQRWQAREQYRSITTKVAPDRKELLRRQWAEYQALPPHEKRMYDVPPTYVKPSERRKRSKPAPQQQREYQPTYP